MQPNANAVDELREEGWVLLQSFLSNEDVSRAQAAADAYYPSAERYEECSEEFAWLKADPFAGVINFPFSDSYLNHLIFDPKILSLTEETLEIHDFVLLRAHLQAKFAGAANYDQPLHRDYGNHTLAVPGQQGEYRQLGFFLYLSDVTEDLGPTHLVSKKRCKDLPTGYTHFFRDAESATSRHFYKKAPELYEVEVPAVGPAGSLLVFELDTLHRSSIITAASGVRLTLGFGYGGSRPWQGY